jgi:predicted nucleotidyltransferase
MPVAPDLVAVSAAFRERGARFVVIGGMAVIAHNVIRTTEDCDLLVPDDQTNDAAVLAALEDLGATPRDSLPLTLERITGREHLRLESPKAGVIDVMRGGVAPLDFDTIDRNAQVVEFHGEPIRFAGLASLVALKRLAGRRRDLDDLEQLELRHGPLPEA